MRSNLICVSFYLLLNYSIIPQARSIPQRTFAAHYALFYIGVFFSLVLTCYMALVLHRHEKRVILRFFLIFSYLFSYRFGFFILTFVNTSFASIYTFLLGNCGA